MLHLPKNSHVLWDGMQWFIDPDRNAFVITFSVGYEVIALDIVHTPSKNATKKKKKQKDSNPQVNILFFFQKKNSIHWHIKWNLSF